MDTPLHRYAAAHDGVVTVRAAARLGYDWPALRRLVRAEGWTRLLPSTYLAPGHDRTPRTLVRAHQLRQPRLVASHRTAAALHGADVLRPALDFTPDGTGRYDVPGGHLYEWQLDDGDVHDLDGLRVTTPARTAADVLRAFPRDEAVIAADGLLRAKVTTRQEVAAALARVRRRPRTKRAIEALRLVDPASGSVAESQARLVFHDARLHPRTQVIVTDRGRRARVDFWFEPGVAVEVEGYAFHSSREQHQSDVARFNALARVPGLVVLRFSWADVFHRPHAMVAAVRAAVTAAAGMSRGI